MNALDNCLLQVFAKQPHPGEVKTRLIPAIGAAGAVAVYRHCLNHSLSLLDTMSNAQLWLNQNGNDPLLSSYPSYLQQGQNLGDKMLHALQQGLKSHRKVILIGSDCLDLTPDHLQQVSEQLDLHDLVIIPATDGGYVLIAVRDRVEPHLFENIEWSSEQVLEQTLQRARACTISHTLLNPLRDIDHLEDLQHYPELQQLL